MKNKKNVLFVIFVVLIGIVQILIGRKMDFAEQCLYMDILYAYLCPIECLIFSFYVILKKIKFSALIVILVYIVENLSLIFVIDSDIFNIVWSELYGTYLRLGIFCILGIITGIVMRLMLSKREG